MATDMQMFLDKRGEVLKKELDAARLELAAVEERREFLRHAVAQAAGALIMLEESRQYMQGTHPLCPGAPAQEDACQNPNGTAPTALVSAS